MRAAFGFGFFLVWTLGFVHPASGQQAVLFISAVDKPPAAWEAIYRQVEECTGKKGKYKAVHWYTTPQPWEGGNGKTWGLWWRSRETGKHSIIVSLGDSALVTALVRHEALHDILWRAGFRPFRMPADSSNNPEHPMPPFGKCAKRSFP
jgi:hypothetical protein